MDFLEISLTIILEVLKLKNTGAMRVIFGFKMFKMRSGLREDTKKIQRKFFVCEITASEDVAINCIY